MRARRFHESVWRTQAPTIAAGFGVVALGAALHARAQEPLPIFDAHVHYSHDAGELVPPKQAIAILRQAGLKRALISRSDDDGSSGCWPRRPIS